MEAIVEDSTYGNELKTKRICRFCLTQTAVLGSIYVRDARMKASAPLPLQIMAIASIEVFSNDGMPSYVCDDCRLHFEYSYRFKQMCKRADTLLRQYPLVKKWPQPLSKPAIPTTDYANKSKIISQEVGASPSPTLLDDTTRNNNKSPILKQTPSIINTSNTINKAKITVPIINTTQTQSLANKTNKIKETQQHKPRGIDTSAPKKLLNATPAETPEPPVPKRLKIEKVDEIKSSIASTIFFDKVDNNEELSMNDVQLLIQSVENEDALLMLSGEESSSTTNNSVPAGKPKILNKSTKRILNKEANITYEPRLSKPQILRDEDGNVEIVTEILDPNEPEEPEPDPLKVAPPVETNVFPCPYCKRSFPLKQLLDIHIVNHTRERNHHCKDCEKSFFTKYDLQKHIVIHTGERPYQCTVCEKSFTRAALLHRHEKIHTDIPKYICVYCEKPFICKDELEKHTERHLKHRPYECQICNKSFAFKQGLERHEVTHSTDKPFNCQYCEMSFITAGKLARHLTAHAGKRAYPCKYCSKSFILSHHLTRHLRSHNDIMSTFECIECSFKCTAMEEYLKHAAEHAVTTKNCQLCKQSLQDQHAIDEHFKDHAKDVFACEFCDLIYLTAQQLQTHTNADHADELSAYELEKGSNGMKSNDKQVNENEEIDLNEMGIYLDDMLVDDILLLNDQDQPEGQPQHNSQHKPREQAVIHESIKIEPATVEEQLQHNREHQQMRTQQKKQLVKGDQPTKTRKVLTADNQIGVSSTMNNNSGRLPTKMATTPPLRRKTPTVVNTAINTTKARPTFSQTKIKIEKEEVISLEKPTDGNLSQVLKTLPKAVTVRRNVPIPKTTQSSPSSVADSNVSAGSANTKASPPKTSLVHADTDGATPLQRRTLRIIKKSPNITAVTSTPTQSNGKNKLKVQRVSLGKDKTDEMTKNKRSK